jgi:UDP:flavonoid glycosyltransferase YjiC (YdhE family)
MRFLFVGRLDVLGPLAAACEDAGHDIAFAGPPSSLPAVESRGFEALAAGLDVDAEPEHVTAAMAGDLAPLAQQWAADLVVHDDGRHRDGAHLGAERAGLPAVWVATRPVEGDLSMLPPSFQPTLRPGLQLLRPGPFPDFGDEEDIAVGPADWAFVMGALLAGRPLVLTPRDDDERYLAFRVCAAGAGLLARPDALRELHDEPFYFANARRLRREIEAMPSPAETVEVLARNATRPPPLGAVSSLPVRGDEAT